MDKETFTALPLNQKLDYLFDKLAVGVHANASADAPTSVAPASQTGFDLGTSNGNWLKNEFEGTVRFRFDVREGQRHVEVTMGVEHDMGGYSYSTSVIRDDGLQVEGHSGSGGNGVVKLLDFIGATEQRGGAESLGKDWPHGAGRFHIDLFVSRKQKYVVQYNHD